jgi:hypothetical protein
MIYANDPRLRFKTAIKRLEDYSLGQIKILSVMQLSDILHIASENPIAFKTSTVVGLIEQIEMYLAKN